MSPLADSLPEQEQEQEEPTNDAANRISVESLVSEIWDNDVVIDGGDGNNDGSTATDSSRTTRSLDSNSGRAARNSNPRWHTSLSPLTESPEGGGPRVLPADDLPPNNVRRESAPSGSSSGSAGQSQRRAADSNVSWTPLDDSNVEIGMSPSVAYRSAQLSSAALQMIEESKASARTSFSMFSEEAFNITAPVPLRSNASVSAPSALSSNGSPPRMPSPPMPAPDGEVQPEPPFAQPARQAMDVAIAGRMQGSVTTDSMTTSPPRTDSVSPPVRPSGIYAGEESLSMRGISGLMTSPGRSSVLSMSAEDPDSARRSQRSPAISSQLSTRTAVEDGNKPASQPSDEERLREMFDFCDVDGAGTVDRLKLVRACRDNRGIADALGLPQHIRQEDRSLDLLERIFQELDPYDNRTASWEDFRAFFQKQSAAASARAALTTEVRAQPLTHEAPARRASEQPATLPSPPAGPPPGESAQSASAFIIEETARRWNAVAAEDVLLQQLKPNERPQAQERTVLRPQGEPEAEAAPGAGSPTAGGLALTAGSPPRAVGDAVSVQAGMAQTDVAARAEVAAARQQARIAEEVMAQANEEAQESQARARELDAQNSKLQRDLQAIKAQLEDRRRADSLQLEEQEASACRRLLDSAGRLESEAQRASEATEALCLRGAELEQEAERLHADQEDARARLNQLDAARAKQWSRLAALAATRSGTEPPPGTPAHALVAVISRDWTEARKISDWRRRQRQDMEGRRDVLQSELAAAQKALQQAATQHAAASCTLESWQHECSARERLADEELAAAQNEHMVLKDARHDWQRARPQLVGLLEELHAGNREGNGQTRDLSDRLVALRRALENNGISMLRGGSPVGSEILGPEDSISNITGTGESKGHDASPGSTGDNEEDFLRPGGLRSNSSGNSLEDEALRVAVEESDLLHKKLLTLEDEKASLIREQEDLIQYIKAKVVPLQRALLVEA